MASIREALAADRRLTIRELIERFDMGESSDLDGTQMSKVILSY